MIPAAHLASKLLEGETPKEFMARRVPQRTPDQRKANKLDAAIEWAIFWYTRQIDDGQITEPGQADEVAADIAYEALKLHDIDTNDEESMEAVLSVLFKIAGEEFPMQEAETPKQFMNRHDAGFDRDRFHKFFEAYLIAALWASTDDDGEPLDIYFGTVDFSDSALKTMRRDCLKFWKANIDAIKDDAVKAGHSFWLTRNRHGSGFLDDDNWGEEIAQSLDEYACTFDEQSLYVGDDDLIYIV